MTKTFLCHSIGSYLVPFEIWHIRYENDANHFCENQLNEMWKIDSVVTRSEHSFPCTLCPLGCVYNVWNNQLLLRFVDNSKVFANMTYISNLWYWKLLPAIRSEVPYVYNCKLDFMGRKEEIKKSKAFCLNNKFLEQLHFHLFDVCFSSAFRRLSVLRHETFSKILRGFFMCICLSWVQFSLELTL